MDYVALGSTGLTVSRIGFGCQPIGGNFGSANEATSHAALHHMAHVQF